MARRLLFYWCILQKPETELAKQVFIAQKLAPVKNDWTTQIKDDLRACNISLTEDEICKMKRAKFKTLVNRNIREAAKNHLKGLKEVHSKSRGLDSDLKVQPYLQTNEMSLKEKQLLFKLRTYTYNWKANFKHQFQPDIKCYACNADDTQEHLLTCSIASDINCLEVKHDDIFGDIKSQIKVIKVMIKIDNRRTSPTIGSHVHPNPMSGA